MLHLLGKKAVIRIRTVSCLLMGWLLLPQASLGQYTPVEKNQADHDAKPYYFGITIGVNLARFQTDLHPRFLQYDSVYVAEPTNSGGFTLGLSATGRLSNRFQVRFNPQLMFIERNIFYRLKYPDFNGDTITTKKVESVIFTFPFQLKFQSDRIGNFRVYAMAGFKFDIDMASNARAKKA